jgi:hypothetical protein
MPKQNHESVHSPERKEFGENVEIILKFIRHGERDLKNNLTDYGRIMTKERARESGIQKEYFNAIKAIGSTSGPKGPSGMQRSLETADIYAREIAGDEAFATRARDVLSYESLICEEPFDWGEMYNSNLPENFSELDPKEKAAVAKKAQNAVANYLVRLNTPEAEAYKREMAGSFAYVIDHYQQMAKRLKTGSRVLIPAGTHGGVMEFILQQAGVRKDEDGKEVKGFIDLREIGGEFDPSEAFNVDIATDDEGDSKPLVVTFDNKNRPQGEFRLDSKIIAELKDYYRELHKL